MESVEKLKGIGSEINKEVKVVKRGRGRKKIKEETKIEDKKKFFLDYSKDEKNHQQICEILREANKSELGVNNKKLGREILIKDIVDYLLPRVTKKDIEAIKEMGLGLMDKVELQYLQHIKKNNLKISFEEYLAKELKIK